MLLRQLYPMFVYNYLRWFKYITSQVFVNFISGKWLESFAVALCILKHQIGSSSSISFSYMHIGCLIM
jgi:hypothetical protein